MNGVVVVLLAVTTVLLAVLIVLFRRLVYTLLNTGRMTGPFFPFGGQAKLPKGRPYAVYRFYDADYQVLRVGQTNNLARRTWQYTREPWWRQVRGMYFETFRTFAEALEAERVTIRETNPRYNVMHTARSESERATLKPVAPESAEPAARRLSQAQSRAAALQAMRDAGRDGATPKALYMAATRSSSWLHPILLEWINEGCVIRNEQGRYVLVEGHESRDTG